MCSWRASLRWTSSSIVRSAEEHTGCLPACLQSLRDCEPACLPARLQRLPAAAEAAEAAAVEPAAAVEAAAAEAAAAEAAAVAVAAAYCLLPACCGCQLPAWLPPADPTTAGANRLNHTDALAPLAVVLPVLLCVPLQFRKPGVIRTRLTHGWRYAAQTKQNLLRVFVHERCFVWHPCVFKRWVLCDFTKPSSGPREEGLARSYIYDSALRNLNI
jgi:hypothetical protein